LVLLPSDAFTSQAWLCADEGDLLWRRVAAVLDCRRVGRKARIDPGPRRESRVTLLLGEDGWVEHVDNGVKYRYDVTKCVWA